MANWIVREFIANEIPQKTARNKARDDIEAILLKENYGVITVKEPGDTRTKSGYLKKILYHFKLKRVWEEKFKHLKKDDVVLIQLPVLNHSFFLDNVIKKMRRKGVRFFAVVHDLECIRMAHADGVSSVSKWRMIKEELKTLKSFTKVIVHNKSMKDFLKREYGISNKKLICLNIFDYLIVNEKKLSSLKKSNRTDLCIIAGNLEPKKAGYVYKLPCDQKFVLYGPNYLENNKYKANIIYKGEFFPDELPYMLEGDFGVIWDGNDTQTCAGLYGQYLKVNNPHKTSLYIAAGIPVIVWKNAAIAEVIERFGCGITISSLNEVREAVSDITDEQYSAMKDRVRKVSRLLRNGYFTKRAINKCFLKQ